MKLLVKTRRKEVFEWVFKKKEKAKKGKLGFGKNNE